jgi:hypothetical protein
LVKLSINVHEEKMSVRTHAASLYQGTKVSAYLVEPVASLGTRDLIKGSVLRGILVQTGLIDSVCNENIICMNGRAGRDNISLCWYPQGSYTWFGRIGKTYN